MTFPDIIKDLRIKQNLTTDAVAENIGVSVAAYRYYERGEREPNISTINKLADFYGVSVDYLLGRTQIKEPAYNDIFAALGIDPAIKATTPEFMKAFSELSEPFQAVIYQAMTEILAKIPRPASEPERKIVYISVMDMPASAGVGIDLDCDEYTSEKAFYEPEADGDFAVQVDGDSMEPDYTDGCYVLIRKYTDGQYPSYGDVALFVCKVDDEYRGFVKQWRDGVLHSLNPEYDDFTSDDIRPIGEVVAVLERV